MCVSVNLSVSIDRSVNLIFLLICLTVFVLIPISLCLSIGLFALLCIYFYLSPIVLLVSCWSARQLIHLSASASICLYQYDILNIEEFADKLWPESLFMDTRWILVNGNSLAEIP